MYTWRPTCMWTPVKETKMNGSTEWLWKPYKKNKLAQIRNKTLDCVFHPQSKKIHCTEEFMWTKCSL